MCHPPPSHVCSRMSPLRYRQQCVGLPGQPCRFSTARLGTAGFTRRAQQCYFCSPSKFDLSEIASELENIFLVDFGTFLKALERVPQGYREACREEVHRRLLSRVPLFVVARKMYRFDLVTGATRSLLRNPAVLHTFLGPPW